MFAGSHVGIVSLGSAHRRFGIVLQEEVRPFRELQLLAFTDDIENFIVPSEQPLTEFPLASCQSWVRVDSRMRFPSRSR